MSWSDPCRDCGEHRADCTCLVIKEGVWKSPMHTRLDETLTSISKLKNFDDKVNQLRQLVVECEDYIKVNYGSLI